MKRNNILKWIVFGIAVAINIFIIVNACINGETSAAESNTVAHTTANVINAVKPQTITSQNFPSFASILRKALGHFALFAFSGIFSTWSIILFTNFDDQIYPTFYSICFGLSVALLSELLQLFAEERSGNFTDVGIDILGYFLGVIIITLIVLIIRIVKNEKNYD